MNLTIVVPIYEQKVGSTIRYKVRFGAQMATGETIQSATATVSPTGPTVSATIDGTNLLVSVSNVAAGAVHRVTAKPTTTGVSPTQVLPLDFDVKGIA